MTQKNKKYSLSSDLKLCECGCGQPVSGINYDLKKPKRFIRGHNSRGFNHHAWKGGRRISHGYIIIKHPETGKMVREHRFIWEQEHQACLLRCANVHHKDRNKLNNHPSNLEAMMHERHLILHHKGAKYNKMLKSKNNKLELYVDRSISKS